MKTIDDLDVRGKRIVIRVDINSPVEKEGGKIVLNPRILSHARTIRELSQKAPVWSSLRIRDEKETLTFWI